MVSRDTGSDFTWLVLTFTGRILEMTTRYSETLPVSQETLKVLNKILQKTGLGGDKEVKQEAVVKGDALQQKNEVAVRVVARSTSFLQQSKSIQL